MLYLAHHLWLSAGYDWPGAGDHGGVSRQHMDSAPGASERDLRFLPLAEPTPELAAAFSRWENDPELVHLARPNFSADDLERREVITSEKLARRLEHNRIYLIYLGAQLVGEMNYQVDPAHLHRREPGTAWIGITIGEATGRGRGVGGAAIRHLEGQIAEQGLRRIELGAFEFNAPALTLYRRLGYREFAVIEGFTYWQGRMWSDIRMEKYLQAGYSTQTTAAGRAGRP